MRNCRYFAEPYLYWGSHCKLLKCNIGNYIVWWRKNIEVKLRPYFEAYESFCWAFVEIVLIVSRCGKKQHLRVWHSQLRSWFLPISKIHTSKIVRIGWLCKDTLGYWHRNRVVKFAFGSLGKARNLLLVVVVPCHTFQYKHHLYSFQELLN